ncbi:MAG: hypothetical protein ACK4GQ_00950 [Candidatus Hadarchaeales archaeon]
MPSPRKTRAASTAPQKPLGEPERADRKLLNELMKWKENAAIRESTEELEILGEWSLN